MTTSTPHPLAAAARTVLRAIRDAVAETAEANERLRLINRPWEQRYVHWSERDGTTRLHGTVPPPTDGRPRGATPSGWCACPRRARVTAVR